MAGHNQDIYDAKLAALAVNFSEQINDTYEPASEETFNKLLKAALQKTGYQDVELDKLNRTINHYVTDSEEDIYSLPEYEAEMPEL